MGLQELGDEIVGAKRHVYLATFPHPRAGSGLAVPSSMSRSSILTKLMQACATPSGAALNRPHQPVSLDYVAVFHEMHKEGPDGIAHGHYHIAVKGSSSFRFAAVKKALMDQSNMASHWSCTHTGYWSPIKYCATPSSSKPRASLDPHPLLWSRVGQHPPLHLLWSEPNTAAAMRAKRQRKEDNASENSKPEPRMTDYELWPEWIQADTFPL